MVLGMICPPSVGPMIYSRRHAVFASLPVCNDETSDIVVRGPGQPLRKWIDDQAPAARTVHSLPRTCSVS